MRVNLTAHVIVSEDFDAADLSKVEVVIIYKF